MISAVLAFSMIFALTGCGDSGGGSSGGGVGNAINQVADNVRLSAARMLQGNVSGEVGATYGTRWFEFTIESIKEIDDAFGYTAPDGYILIDVVVTETGTFDEPIIMGTFDFYMDSDTFLEYEWPIDPLDDSMMPLEFYLAKDETVTYRMVFEVPASLDDLKLMYTEIDENMSIYATFVIDVNI